MTADLVWADVAGAVALLALTVLLAVLSALVERSGPIRLRHWAEEAGGRLRSLYEAAVRFEVYRYLLNLLARFAPLALFVDLERLAGPRAGLAGVAGAAGGVILVLALAELLNRGLVARAPEEALRRLTWAYRALLLAAQPLVGLLALVVPPAFFERREEEEVDEVSDEEIEAFIKVGTREGILEPGEEDLLWRIVDFGNTQVRSVMTPRIDMVCAPVESDLETLAETFLEAKHARIPLFAESVDRIVGILHIRDLLEALRSARPPSARSIAKPPYVVPETKSLDELLKEFQVRHQQLAIVVDEYGGTAGLVTVEDVVEEIVGEIFDEHEILEPASEHLPDGSWRLDGGLRLETLEEIFGVDLPENPFETVGGLVFGTLGHVPEAGESIERFGLRFVVEQVEDRRVLSARVRRSEPATDEAASGGDASRGG